MAVALGKIKGKWRLKKPLLKAEAADCSTSTYRKPLFPEPGQQTGSKGKQRRADPYPSVPTPHPGPRLQAEPSWREGLCSSPSQSPSPARHQCLLHHLAWDRQQLAQKPREHM